ncbi:S1C family serine protease [Frondihabitans peucedani]|uniref:Trypsin-like peptidase domain-containing protein n=1 Tax=Frondihabitans peucedani TaxID=598626 RepID=A0ABP8E402_9MICO
MTETPGTDDDRFGGWQAPHADSRQTGEQPTVEPAEAGPAETRPSEARPTDSQPTEPQATLPYPSAPVGAPPLPSEAPVPLSESQAEAASDTGSTATGDGFRRAPASLDHAAYAGSNSSAFNGLSQGGYGQDGSGDGYGTASAGAADGSTPGWSAPVAPRPRRRGLGALVAVAVVAAVIGALVATGGYALLGGRNVTAEGGTPSNLTIGHYDDATIVTAVASKATPSVVTIDVSSGTSAGTGSGVVLTSDGYIVTNTHVVTLDGASATGTVRVTTSSGRIYSGKIVGTDPLVDLAVVKIDASGLTPIDFADSSKLNVGDTAVAIGAPLGLSNTVTDGIVSTLNRSISVASSAVPDNGGDSSDGQDNNGQGPFSFDNGSGSTPQTSNLISLPVIQTDASINPGNSGGALLDAKGRLIGINVAIASAGQSSDSSTQSGSIGVGFSIPANLVKRVADDIKKTGSATHGLLGASVDDATSDTTASHTGALIKSLTSSGAAERAGLRAGDVVTEFDGNAVTGATDLTAQVRTLSGGATGSLTYIRDGSTRSATVTLGTLKG